MLMQEGRNSLQAIGMGRKLSNQAGIGFAGETDADPVGAGTDVDAGGVRMLHGQRFDLGGLLQTKGFALGLGPGLATAVSLAVGLSFLGAVRRGGGWLASGRRCSHGRTPRKRKGEGSGGQAPRPCAGESAGASQCYKREPRDRGKYPRGSGSPVMRPKTLPGSELQTGKTQRSLSHQ